MKMAGRDAEQGFFTVMAFRGAAISAGGFLIYFSKN
jgi:hypothetical protein